MRLAAGKSFFMVARSARARREMASDQLDLTTAELRPDRLTWFPVATNPSWSAKPNFWLTLPRNCCGRWRLPVNAVAAGAGLLNESQVRLLTGCRAQAEASYDDHIDETLVGLDSIGELSAACHAWVAAAEAVDSPDPADLAAPEPEPSTVHLSETFEGRWHLEGNLSPQDGQLLNQALEGGISRYLQAKRDGDPSLETLSIPGLRAQALVDLAGLSLRCKPGHEDGRSRSVRSGRGGGGHRPLIARLGARLPRCRPSRGRWGSWWWRISVPSATPPGP